MGKYYNCEDGRRHGKGDALVAEHGAHILTPAAAAFIDCTKDGLIVVVNNGPFEAAAWAYDNRERDEFLRNMQDYRPKKCYILDRAICEEICK